MHQRHQKAGGAAAAGFVLLWCTTEKQVEEEAGGSLLHRPKGGRAACSQGQGFNLASRAWGQPVRHTPPSG